MDSYEDDNSQISTIRQERVLYAAILERAVSDLEIATGYELRLTIDWFHDRAEYIVSYPFICDVLELTDKRRQRIEQMIHSAELRHRTNKTVKGLKKRVKRFRVG